MNDQKPLRILAIRTDFVHHGEHSGYKQILKFIQAKVILGVDERKGEHTTGLRSKYQWLFEFDIRPYRKSIDLIHILYGEDYLRFSPALYPEIPVVATFHQPAEALEREVLHGSLRGRVGRLTHALSRKRFERLAAAIVTEEGQKRVLEHVMPKEKIHVIPLGVHLAAFRKSFRQFGELNTPLHSDRILTVGNWLRDWDFLANTARLAAVKHPQWSFHLVNRAFDLRVRELLAPLSNVHIHEGLTDEALREMLYTSRVLFIPVVAASGNNALLEAMAMGCPVVMTDVFADEYMISEPAVRLYEAGVDEHAMGRLEEVMEMNTTSYAALKATTFARASEFDWEEIARRTMEVYQTVVRK